MTITFMPSAQIFVFHSHGEDIVGINKLIFQLRKAQFGEVLKTIQGHTDGKLLKDI